MCPAGSYLTGTCGLPGLFLQPIRKLKLLQNTKVLKTKTQRLLSLTLTECTSFSSSHGASAGETTPKTDPQIHLMLKRMETMLYVLSDCSGSKLEVIMETVGKKKFSEIEQQSQ